MSAKLAGIAAACAAVLSVCAAAALPVPFQVEGDAIRAPLTRDPPDVARGREIVKSRDAGACLLCHAVPETGERFVGNLAPSLAGVGAHFSAAQLRLRLVDSRRVVPDTIMPAYYSVEGLRRVGAAYRGKTILSAQQIEDVVAYLASLKEQPQ